MPDQVRTPEEAEHLFRQEHERIARSIYKGQLPPWPGLIFIKSRKLWAQARWGDGYAKPYKLNIDFSIYAPDPAFYNVVRHEIAHLGCRWANPAYTGDHGPEWKLHAIKCGAEPVAQQSDASFMPLTSPEPWRVMLECQGCGGRTFRHRAPKTPLKHEGCKAKNNVIIVKRLN